MSNLAKIIFDCIDGASETNESGVPYTYNSFANELKIGVDGEIDCKKFASTFEVVLNAAGFVIVPKEPTEKTLGELYGLSGETSGSDKPARELYRAMIAAATGEPPP